MNLILLTAVVISRFAVGAGFTLLMRYRDWRFGFLAGLALFAAAWVAATQIAHLFGEAGAFFTVFEQYTSAFPTLVLSVLALSVMFFLERIIHVRAETQQNLKLAQVSLDRASIPVFWFTSEGKIRYVNKGAREFLGYSREELLSKTIHDIAPSYLPADWRRDWLYLKERGSTNMELHYSTSDGQRVSVDVTAIYVGSKFRELGCMFVRDITERMQAEANLRVAMGEVERANRSKSEFLAFMSHELRTPLNAIIGFSEIIKHETFGPVGSVRYRDYAVDIHDSGQHLLDLINDILDLSKIESGADELREENIEIHELVGSVMALVKGPAKKGGVELETELEDHLPMLLADKRKIKQILINLLSNAVKFTLAGGKVRLRIWFRTDGGHVFEVTDTGIGIALEDIPKALAPFSQVDSNLNRNYEGTGLGLPLTKALTELHGGSLDLRSEVSVGTTVTVRFPAERVDRASHDLQNLITANELAG